MEGHRIIVTQDGTRSLFSERFGVTYHSKYGAWRETQHVFVDAGLRYAAIDRTAISILEIGFGTGLNCIASLLHCAARAIDLDYVGIDAFPVPRGTLAALSYAEDLAWEARAQELWTRLCALPWPSTADLAEVGSPRLLIEKRVGRCEDLNERERYDLVYYDAFAPEAQPELWTRERFAQVREALRLGGALVTYCAKGQVKRDLRAVGFEVERLAGPPGKREMTRATKV